MENINLNTEEVIHALTAKSFTLKVTLKQGENIKNGSQLRGPYQTLLNLEKVRHETSDWPINAFLKTCIN